MRNGKIHKEMKRHKIKDKCVCCAENVINLENNEAELYGGDCREGMGKEEIVCKEEIVWE